MGKYILSIDQGTTSTRAMIFDLKAKGQKMTLACASKELSQSFPKPGWVEHDGQEIITDVIDTCRQVMAHVGPDKQPSAIGITNQRETTLVWDRETGKAIYPAIVWQDRRTADLCENLKAQGHEAMITARTGLLLDPYFSATKIAWILDNVAGARQQAEQGKLAFGTVDSFILWHLTGGTSHMSDVTNASRTMLYNIHDLEWDKDLLDLFNIPSALLPEVHDCDYDYGVTQKGLFKTQLPISGIAGDQQAALIGQNCLEKGSMKCTYGTGAFVMMNVGDKPIKSTHRLLTTIGYRLQGKTAYALEGSIFSAGSAVQWLRDGLGIIDHAHESEALALSVKNNGGVMVVPAFTGLGAPHWQAEVQAAIFGITRGTGRAEIAYATLESVALQTSDLLRAMARDSGISLTSLKVDGGMVANKFFLQCLSNILDIPLFRTDNPETTALGAALIAGIRIREISNINDLSTLYGYDFVAGPGMEQEDREILLTKWQKAIQLACNYKI